jgi:hypothetical protein
MVPVSRRGNNILYKLTTELLYNVKQEGNLSLVKKSIRIHNTEVYPSGRSSFLTIYQKPLANLKFHSFWQFILLCEKRYRFVSIECSHRLGIFNTIILSK